MRQVAGYDSTVLILGESGCGKELVARHIHELSARSRRAVRPRQLRRDSPRAARERVVRSREGCLHGRADHAHRPVRACRRRHAVSRRDRRHEPRHASEAPARTAGAHVRARRQRRARRANVRISPRRTATSRRASRRASFAKTCSFGSTCFRSRASAARACRRPACADRRSRAAAAKPTGGRRSCSRETALECMRAYRGPATCASSRTSSSACRSCVPNQARSSATSFPTPIGERRRTRRFPECHPETAASICASISATIEKQLIRSALDQTDGTVAHAARLLKLRRTTLVEKLRKYEIDAQA